LSLDESRASLARAGVDFRTPPPAEMRPVAFGRWFSGIEAPPRLADLERICAQFRPDAIVHEVAELAGPLAASLAGIPWATVGFGPLLQPDVADIAGEGVAPLWRAKGLAPPPRAGLYQYLYVDPYPRALQIPEIDQLPAIIRIRPAGGSGGVGARAEGRRVYVTFGTNWNSGPAAVERFRAALAGSADAGEEAIATVGSDVDPAILGSLPANATAHRFVPQDELLPSCACVVGHGGSGTLLGALAWGEAVGPAAAICRSVLQRGTRSPCGGGAEPHARRDHARSGGRECADAARRRALLGVGGAGAGRTRSDAGR
jgi:hypothetical protein